MEQIFKSRGGVEYFADKTKPELRLILRGQPTENSPFTVLRAKLERSIWDLQSSYMSGDIINKIEDFSIGIEGSTEATMLILTSRSVGIIEIPIVDNKFDKCEYTQSINIGRRHKFSEEMILKVPNDIITVSVR